MHRRKHMSPDHHPPLRDVTADTENTSSSIVGCWAVFTEQLPGNALIKSVTILLLTHLCVLKIVNLTNCAMRSSKYKTVVYLNIYAH
jgi:hypothetical protein